MLFVFSLADDVASGRTSKGVLQMISRERVRLRTRLRQVNIEYSELVRNRCEKDRFVRMTALRIERRTIMSLLFGGERTEHLVPAAGQCQLS
jgi:hypothetical protein